MDAKFKCCKKDVTNIICISCFNFFHPSCLERKTKAIRIGGPRILCSEECQRKYNEDTKDDCIKKLEEELDELANELKQKDSYINKLKRRTQDFEDEVTEAEIMVTERMENQQREIMKLNKIIMEKEEDKQELVQILENQKHISSKFEDNIKHLEMLNNQLLTTIKVMEEENLVIKEEILHLKKELKGNVEKPRVVLTGNIRSNSGTLENTKNSGTSRKIPLQRKKRILIVCDETGRGVDRELRKHLGDFEILTISKPGADMNNLLVNIEQLIEDFTLDDHLIILGGSNGYYHGIKPSVQITVNKLKMCTNTNILIGEIPLPNIKGKDLKRCVNNFNFSLHHNLEKINYYSESKVNVININNNEGYPINKRNMGYKIINSILKEKNKKCPNIFVNLNSTSGSRSNADESSRSNENYNNNVSNKNNNHNKIVIVDDVEILSVSKELNFLELPRNIVVTTS